MDKLPLITIIIPIYGNENLLNESLSSSINQTYKNLEIIIISDGSKKINIINNIINNFKDNRIKFINNNNNLGVSSVLNQGIKLSKGKYISWLSHDDVMHQNKIEIQYKFLKEKNASIVYSNFILFNKHNNYYIKSINLTEYHNQYLTLLSYDNINGCTFLLDKKIFNESIKFNLNFKHVQDYDLWLRLSKRYVFHYMDDFFIFSRDHPNQTSKIENKSALKEKKFLYTSNYLDFIKKNNKYYDIIFLTIKLASRNYLNYSKILHRYNFFTFTIFLCICYGFLIFIAKNIIKKLISVFSSR